MHEVRGPGRNAVLAIALLIALSLPSARAQEEADSGLGAADQTLQLSVFKNLNPRDSGPAEVDLAQVANGNKAMILYYWIAGHARADKEFQLLQEMIAAGSDHVQLFGVAVQRPDRGTDVIAARARELGIDVPVLDDEGFQLGQTLRVQSVPNITIVDARGVLRLTNGGSLNQVIGYKLTVGDAIRRVAETGKLGTYGYLPRYYPARELVGKKCPDFKAPLLSTKVEQQLSSLLSDDKLNVLIFWSVDCPHCRDTLPKMSKWLAGQDKVNALSAARVTNEAVRIKTQEYCEYNDFAFPTLVDQDLRISDLYQVTTTPTIVIIGPDGVVDSVLLSSLLDFEKKIEEASRKLL